jgi:hypothetical protein
VRHSRIIRGLALAAALAATGASAPAAAAPRALPAAVYAPYYETYLAPGTPGLAATARASGARYFTLAFLQATGTASCTLAWNGNPAQPLGYYRGDIAALRALGGDVIPSFGGYSADHGGTEIADACPDPARIAAAYETVITVLGVTRLDMDVEDNSLSNAAGIARRNEAIALTGRWAARHHIPLQIQYTLPVEPTGLDASGVAVLRSAAAHHAAVSSVNIMVFDYYLPGDPVMKMGQAAIQAATATHGQLAAVYPGRGPARLWAMQAMTLLPGIDDEPKLNEITSRADARAMLGFARAKGMNLLSAWAIQRDNGGCPGTPDSDTCSGIAQPAWAFSHLLAPFTR